MNSGAWRRGGCAGVVETSLAALQYCLFPSGALNVYPRISTRFRELFPAVGFLGKSIFVVCGWNGWIHGTRFRNHLKELDALLGAEFRDERQDIVGFQRALHLRERNSKNRL